MLRPAQTARERTSCSCLPVQRAMIASAWSVSSAAYASMRWMASRLHMWVSVRLSLIWVCFQDHLAWVVRSGSEWFANHLVQVVRWVGPYRPNHVPPPDVLPGWFGSFRTT